MTRSEWRFSKHWCTQCEKFECFSCTFGTVCPACGNPIENKDDDEINVISSFICILFLIMFVGQCLTGDSLNASIPWLIISLIFLGISYKMNTIISTRIRKHESYLSTIPQGKIPPKERAGFNDQDAREKWRSHNLHHLYSRNEFRIGIIPEFSFEGLLGNWDYPVMSPDERAAFSKEGVKRAKMLAGFFFTIGLFFMIPGIINHNILSFVMCWGSSFSMALFFILLMILGRRGDPEDKIMITNVMWKSKGYEGMNDTIEEFLVELGEEYTMKTAPFHLLSEMEYFDRRYIFENENYIQTHHSNIKEGMVKGSVSISYMIRYYDHAKVLQQKLDKFLAAGDKIVTIHDIESQTYLRP